MNTFKEEITCAMKAETQEQKLAGAGAIRVMELLIQRNAFLQVQTFNKSRATKEPTRINSEIRPRFNIRPIRLYDHKCIL